MGLLKAVIGLVLFILIAFGAWIFYDNFLAGRTRDFKISNYNSDIELDLANVSGEIKQFYDNMRFNHNKISYYINPNCDWDKKARMKEAFVIVNEKTRDLISFYPAYENEADILIGCSIDSYEKEENLFIAGEGGPTRIVNSSMPVITKGKVLLYNESRAICDDPLLELHELLHVFGYDHINDSTKIMYPYLDCSQKVDSDLISHIVKSYSIEPFADLYFENAEATKERTLGMEYLNFNISIVNYGIIDAKSPTLAVYAENKLVKSFNLDDAGFGSGENFYAKNLLLPSRNDNITFELETATKESNKENNKIELEI